MDSQTGGSTAIYSALTSADGSRPTSCAGRTRHLHEHRAADGRREQRRRSIRSATSHGSVRSPRAERRARRSRCCSARPTRPSCRTSPRPPAARCSTRATADLSKRVQGDSWLPVARARPFATPGRRRTSSGSSLAVVGPVLALAGVLAPSVGLALVPVLYAVGALAAPAAKKVELASGVDAGDVDKSLERDRATDARSGAARDRASGCTAISTTITDTLPRADALGSGSNALLRAGEDRDRLPPVVVAGLPRPPAHLRRPQGRRRREDGARRCCRDQLDVLAAQMDEVADAVNRADTDKLVANGRFLAEKFGTGPLELSRRPRPPPPPGIPAPGRDASRDDEPRSARRRARRAASCGRRVRAIDGNDVDDEAARVRRGDQSRTNRERARRWAEVVPPPGVIV